MKRFTTILILLLTPIITAVAEEKNKYNYIIVGTPYEVNIDWSRITANPDNALPAAEEWCTAYGRHAQFAGHVRDFTAIFHCVDFKDSEPKLTK